MADQDPHIKCRSKRTESCYDGATIAALGMTGFIEDWRDDGTYDPDTDTVVCDPCYMALGQPGIDINHPDARTFGRSIDQGDPRNG